MSETPSKESISFLKQLLDTPAPSGFEEPAAEVWCERAKGFATVHQDTLGNSFATVNKGGGPRVAVIGHLDEIGLIISRIDEQGYLRFESIGGWDRLVLPGQRVRIVGTPAGGMVVGSVARPAVHVLSADARNKVPEISDLWIDIGARDADHAKEMVQVGDPAVMDVTPQVIGGDGSTRLMSRCIDNRVGAFVALEAARLAGERDCGAEVVAVGSVGEEIGMGGATAAAFSLQPDFVCVVDVTTPGDTPGGSDIGDLALGKGPIISRGATLSEPLVRQLTDACDEADIPYQLRAKGRRTATDADQTIKAGAGVAGCLVSVPARYLHSPVEQVDLVDIQTSIEAIVAWATRLARESN